MAKALLAFLPMVRAMAEPAPLPAGRLAVMGVTPTPFGTGERIVHLDLHPLNVMLTAAGPVVIDWTNAAACPPGTDVAMTCLIVASSDLDAVPWWIRPAAWSLRKVFLRRFQAAVRDDPGPYLAQRWLNEPWLIADGLRTGTSGWPAGSARSAPPLARVTTATG